MSDAIDITEPSERPKPKLKLPDAPQSLNASTPPGQQSTRRRPSMLSFRLFSSPVNEGNTREETAKMTLKEAIEALNKLSMDDDMLLILGKRLLELMPNTSKVAEAAKLGAFDALAHALWERGIENADVAHALLPALINLSAGDDDAGLKRTSTLVNLDMIAIITSILNAHSLTDATHVHLNKFELACEIAHRCVWCLQHCCRRSSAASVPWLAKIQGAATLPKLITLTEKYRKSPKLMTRVCFVLADIAHALGKAGGASMGMASAVHLDPKETRLSLIEPIIRVLKSPLTEEGMPKRGCEVHEAAAMALGDVLTSPELCTKAVSAGALRPLVEAMNRYPAAHSLQINGAAAGQVVERRERRGRRAPLTANMAYRGRAGCDYGRVGSRRYESASASSGTRSAWRWPTTSKRRVTSIKRSRWMCQAGQSITMACTTRLRRWNCDFSGRVWGVCVLFSIPVRRSRM